MDRQADMKILKHGLQALALNLEAVNQAQLSSLVGPLKSCLDELDDQRSVMNNLSDEHFQAVKHIVKGRLPVGSELLTSDRSLPSVNNPAVAAFGCNSASNTHSNQSCSGLMVTSSQFGDQATLNKDISY